MKVISYLLFILSLILLSACGDDEAATATEVEDPRLDLIAPIDALIPAEFIAFEWDTNQEEVLFELFHGSFEGTPILRYDTLVSGNKVMLDYELCAGASYLWRVSADDEYKEADFSTESILEAYEGTYIMTGYRHNYDFDNLDDTIYIQDTIQLTKHGQQLRINESTSEKMVDFYSCDADLIRYGYYETEIYELHEYYVTFDVTSDVVHIYSHDAYNADEEGGGSSYSVSGTKD